ncbi:hypothetical protein G9P44_002313 [Scheffersomyces stipitis]|nr:hypothetical protein G9P44_002313 [Scheffersomyces stipitis]
MSIAEPVWGHNELVPMEEMEWNDHKQQLLTRYVEDYADSLSDPSLFFQRIDWQHLLKTLDVHNLELLQLKVDELYDSRFSGFEAGENVNIAEIVDHWKKKRNPLFREVARMIESLGLESFETESPRSENVPNISTSSVANVRRTSGSGTRPSLSRNPNSFHIPRQEMPKMTKTQRRMSLDLMHSQSAVSDIMSGGHRRNSSLTKPAESSTTNVNVITKAEVISTPRAPPLNQTSSLTKNRLKGVQKKFRFVLGSKSKLDLPKTRNPNSSISNDTSKPVEEGDKKSRRLSLVGENLPLYIRKQLEISPRSTSVILEPSVDTDEHIEDPHIESNVIATSNETTSVRKTESKNQKQVVKKKSRLQNLLANSQSLYSHSKDVNSARSSLASSNISSSNKTSNTSAGGTPHYDSDEEDDNKEYISPDSLTRYYGMQADDNGDHEEILKEIDENEDDIDFVNVNESYDVLVRRVADDDRENTHHDYDDDDYLFKI